MSAEWADYVITEVHYGENPRHIIEVKVFRHDAQENKLYDKEIMSREDVIAEITSDMTFVTAIKGSNGKYSKGSNVETILVNRTRYLRTDQNNIPEDNLGNLPEF